MRSKSFTAAALAARLSLLSLPAVLLVARADAQEQALIQFAVDAQPLAHALVEFSRQADTTVTAPTRLTEGKHSPGFTGMATPAEAIAALLQGTGLEARSRGGALVIDRAAQEAAVVGTLRGQVLSADALRPLRQVQVSVLGTDLSTTTDRFGRFELHVPAGGTGCGSSIPIMVVRPCPTSTCVLIWRSSWI